MRFFFILLMSIASVSFSIAQADKFVHIGSKMPATSFSISHYTSPTARIADFKGKYVLLDLWGVYCSGCIANMPHIQRLQAQYKDRLQVIMVTKNKEAEVKKLAMHSENVKNNTLPSVMGDSAFVNLFDYRFVPTYIWIDPEGIVRHITGEVKEEDLAAFLAGKPLHLNEKVDVKINPEEPAMVGWYPYSNQFGMYSYLAPYPSDANGGGSGRRLTNDSGNVYWINNIGTTFDRLYLSAYQWDAMHVCRERLIVNISDTSVFENSDYETKKNIFIYELIANNNAPTERVYRYMQRELDFYLNARSTLQKRELTCYVLKRLPGTELYLPVSDTAMRPNVDENGEKGDYKANNVGWRWVWGVISYARHASHQLLDETGIAPNRKVDFRFNYKHWDNIPLLNAELQPYGLYVSVEKRPLDCIVIEDDKP